MNIALWLAIAMTAVGNAAGGGTVAETKDAAHEMATVAPQAVFTSYEEFEWDKILPDLGDSSPEICILHVDPKTQATKLMIRTPKAIHVRNTGTARTRPTPCLWARRCSRAMVSGLSRAQARSITCPPKWCTKHGCRQDPSHLSRWIPRGTSTGWKAGPLPLT